MGSDWSLATRKPVSFRKSLLIALAMVAALLVVFVLWFRHITRNCDDAPA